MRTGFLISLSLGEFLFKNFKNNSYHPLLFYTCHSKPNIYYHNLIATRFVLSLFKPS